MYSVPNMPESVIVRRPKLRPALQSATISSVVSFALKRPRGLRDPPPFLLKGQQMAAARLLVVVAAAVALCGVAVLTLGSVREHNVAETGERVSKSSIESAVVLCSVR